MIECIFIITVFFAWGILDMRRKRDKELVGRALRITKFFGDVEIALFRFIKKKGDERSCVWALVKFNDRINNIYNLPNHEKYLVVDSVESASDKVWAQKDKEVRKLLQQLPYHISILEPDIDFKTYQSIAEARKEQKLMNGIID